MFKILRKLQKERPSTGYNIQITCHQLTDTSTMSELTSITTPLRPATTVARLENTEIQIQLKNLPGSFTQMNINW